MTSFARPDGSASWVATRLQAVSARLRSESPADTVACAFGIGSEVHAWWDESDGRLFDLASLTKPLFTARAVLDLLADGDDLSDAAADLGIWATGGSRVVRDLLQHTAGLPAELPTDVAAESVVDWARTRLAPNDGFDRRVVYSDVGYWMLGRLVAATTREPLYRQFERTADALSAEFAFGSVRADRAVRSGPVVGDRQLVHDPAARHLGESGHAGAFGTLEATVAATVGWLDRSWARTSLGAEALSCQTHEVPGGHRSLAWTLIGDPHHPVAHDWPTTTVCHTGFTGVSIAWDPVTRWWAVLLSNAIPVDRDATPILIARRLFHAIAATALRAESIPESRGEN